MSGILTFELGGARCAIFASEVVEVQRAVAMALLARGPPIVEGVIDLRGALVPVLDLRSCLRLPPRALEPSDHLIIARVRRREGLGERRVAIRVDRALEIVSVPEPEINRATESIPGAGHLAGSAPLAGGLVLIHDLARFLSLDEERELEQSLAAAVAP